MMSTSSVNEPRFLYIHGFNSSPASVKAQIFSATCHRYLPECKVELPELSHDPDVAIRQLEETLNKPGGVQLMVGSSLGGYYATWLAERYDLLAALVNPAVSPTRNLGEEFLGPQTNYYSGKQYELTMEHVRRFERLDCEIIRRPENYLVLLQTGDEVLDYRLAVERYRDCRQIVQEGGSHSFDDFETIVPEILRFAGFDV